MATGNTSTRLLALLQTLRKQWDLQGERDTSRFARKLGLTHSTILRWEQGGSIGRSGVESLAGAIGETAERVQAYLDNKIELSELQLPGAPGSKKYDQVLSLLPSLETEQLWDLLLRIPILLRERLTRKSPETQFHPASTPLFYASIADVVQHNWDTLIQQPKLSARLPALRDGDVPTEMDLFRIAAALDIDEQRLEDLARQGEQPNSTTD
jgi:transcriptional regulator with XRE-family HTH domain